jgi:hypothetical protein
MRLKQNNDFLSESEFLGLLLSESGLAGFVGLAGLKSNSFYPENPGNPANPDSDNYRIKTQFINSFILLSKLCKFCKS